ncbi:hypothetical protein TFLX_04162 [Thermoflexales bacterium]|nr:hypothetical protein TFLX_04162 [Thermoflexales bacterium]
MTSCLFYPLRRKPRLSHLIDTAESGERPRFDRPDYGVTVQAWPFNVKFVGVALVPLCVP